MPLDGPLLRQCPIVGTHVRKVVFPVKHAIRRALTDQRDAHGRCHRKLILLGHDTLAGIDRQHPVLFILSPHEQWLELQLCIQF